MTLNLDPLFYARQLHVMFCNGHEIELVSRGMMHTQIWVHINGRIYADDVQPQLIGLWREQALAFYTYVHTMVVLGREPSVVSPI